MQSEQMKKWLTSSHLSGGNASYVEALYEAYINDPQSVPVEWRDYFQQLPTDAGPELSHAQIRNEFEALAKNPYRGMPAQGTSSQWIQEKKQAHVLQLINAYRLHGHHHANLDPLNISERVAVPDLELSHHQLSDADKGTTFSTESPLSHNGATLETIEKALQRTYCDSFAIEYMHITNNAEIKWLQDRLESVHSHPTLAPEEQQKILEQLTAAEGLEKYLGSKYVGQKRFSLEGGDSLIPLLDAMITRAGDLSVKEIVMGMAHRGRLNVLVNILGKSPDSLFEEFEGKSQSELSGDVKYHMGFSSNLKTSQGMLHLALAFNPSHLEIITPVVQGSVRARQRRRGDLVEKSQVMAIAIHGDAAFAGQGVVMETFNFSQARGYATGGTVHIVINNQIGFTTSNPLDARSTLYCTDVAKMVQAPIIHVNGNDPEACVFAAKLAMDYRMQFKKDIVIDLVCYRRHGHNEADEPSVTQPKMYNIVRQIKTPRELYANQLIQAGVVTEDQAQAFVYDYRDALDKGEAVVKTVDNHVDEFSVDWSPYLNQRWDAPVDTAVSVKRLQSLYAQLDDIPEQFTTHPVVKRLLEERRKMMAGDLPMNWGLAETLAYGSLVEEGYPVRLSGQDSGRGTFAHRHAVLHDYQSGEIFIPLQSLSAKRDQVIVIDSVLSEEAVLGFEYGYAASEPNVLVIWEAQFGDFANGAQVVIDQFISSGEQKWGRLSGLVMFLPHGYEGQGPEHSSARLERYLQLCAQHNMQVCTPTTPAQVFHMLRRQMIRPFRKPLIVMTPKSLLRHKQAVSSLDDLAKGEFQLIIPEIDPTIKAKDVKRVVLCGGKVYYDLLDCRQKNKRNDVAIIRIEQLYPFPKAALTEALAAYPNAKDVIWCQEEPRNQGAWYPTRHNIELSLAPGQSLQYIGRDYFAAPAVGYTSLHLSQQKCLVEHAILGKQP